MTKAAFTVGCLLLTACSGREMIRPDESKLDFAVPEVWREPAAAGEVRGWLDELGQPELTRLVIEAWARNPDLRTSLAVIGQAQAQVRLAGSRDFPQLSLSGTVGRGRVNVEVPPSDAGPGYWMKILDRSYDVGLMVAWEIDLFGGNAAERRGAEADAWAAVEGTRWAHFSLAGQLVRTWLRLIAADRLVALAEELAANQARAREVTEERFAAGIAGALEVHAAEIEWQGAAAALAERRQQRELVSQGMTALLGRYPDAGLVAGADLPELPLPPAAGLPSELLARRPDVRSSALRVLATGERIWNAKTAFFPRLALTATGGYRSDAIRHLLDPERLVWNLLGNLSAPILDGGRNQAVLDLRRAQQYEALARYQAVVLRAFGEVEGALAAGERLTERTGHVAAAVAAAEATLHRAREQYDAGLIGLLELLGVERRRLEAQMGLVAMRLACWDNRIDLYLALGGDLLAAP
jgi:NodT family efflux transporter outer membrane factor (OMF) lipoprotein